MQCRKLYLEAPSRTQDLLTTKWTLYGKGYTITSTWHEDPRAGLGAFEGHWSADRLDEMRQSDALVVLAGQPNDNLSLAAMAGIALAHGMRVIWIGPLVEVLRHQSKLQHFRTAAEFHRLEVTSPEWPFARLAMAQAA